MWLFQLFAAAGCSKERILFGLPRWYAYLPTKQDSITGRCEVGINYDPSKPFDVLHSIVPIGLAVIDMLLVIAGIVAVGFVIYGGIRYVVSQGSPDQTSAALNTIINALVGGVIAMLALAIVSFVGNKLGGTGSATNQGLPVLTANNSAVESVLVTVLNIVGAIAFVIVTLAGFKYVISRGEPAEVNKAKDTILYALIGLVVVILARVIVAFVFNKVT